MSTDKSEWWFPQLTDDVVCDEVRTQIESTTNMSNKEVNEYWNDGRKYVVNTWHTMDDAYEEYEALADAYLKLLEEQS